MRPALTSRGKGVPAMTRFRQPGGFTMSPLTARSTSIALVGGVAAMLYLTLGLLFWAGIIAWAACMEAGGDSDAVRKTIAGNAFGAVMGWIALTVALLVPVSPEGWVWVPRAAIPVAITLFVARPGDPSSRALSTHCQPLRVRCGLRGVSRDRGGNDQPRSTHQLPSVQSGPCRGDLDGRWHHLRTDLDQAHGRAQQGLNWVPSLAADPAESRGSMGGKRW